MKPLIALVSLAALVLVACAAGGPSGTAPAGPSVTRTADIPYTKPVGGYTSGLRLDVYAPASAHNLPLVVLLHGGGANKLMFGYPTIAEDLARRGAVVVVPDWGLGGLPRPPVADALTTIREAPSVAACAVSFAVGHAKDYGADPSRLVLTAHSGGANTAAMLALNATGVPVHPSCLAGDTTAKVTGLALWDGDWLLEDPSVWAPFEQSQADMAAFLAGATPWSLLETAPRIPTVLMTSSLSRETMTRCDAWLLSRDPAGTFRNGLEAIGAFANGCVDVAEESDLLAQTMNELGFQVTRVPLADTTHTNLAASDRETLVSKTLDLARA